MDRIKQIDHELDLIDARLGVLNQYYEDSANHRLHFEELCNTLRGFINQVRNDRNELEQEKKRLCGINQTESKSNSVNSSLFQSVGAVVEDCVQAIQTSMNADLSKTLND